MYQALAQAAQVEVDKLRQLVHLLNTRWVSTMQGMELLIFFQEFISSVLGMFKIWQGFVLHFGVWGSDASWTGCYKHIRK